MIKIHWILLCVSTFTFAIDSSNMFFTPEPYNMYSEPLEEPKKQKEAEVARDKDGKLPFKEKLKGGDLFFNGFYGLVIYSGYNRPGTAFTVSATKHLSKIVESLPGLFAEADFTLPMQPNNDGKAILPDIKITSGGVYGGYMFVINDKTYLEPKLGLAYLSDPVGGFTFAYGASIVRKIAVKVIDLVGDIRIKGDAWNLNVGIRYKYQR